MPATNTTELGALIKDWLNRDDLDTVLDTFIAAADSRILADGRSRGEMTQQRIVKTRVNPQEKVNPVPINTKYYPEWFGFYEEGYDPTVDEQPTEQALTEDTYNYEFLNVYVDDQEYHRVTVDEFYQNNRGRPENVYTIIGGRLFIDGFPDLNPDDTAEIINEDQQAYDLTLIVFKKDPIVFPDASQGADEGTDAEEEVVTTSELLRSIPLAYLYGSLVEAAIYLRDTEATALYQARYDEFMNRLYEDYKRKQVSSGWAVKSVGGDRLFNTRRA